MRIGIGMVLYSAVFCLIMFRLFECAVSPAKTINAKAQPKSVTHDAKRPDVVDRNGVALAATLKTRSFYVNPKQVKNPDELAGKLAGILKADKTAIKKKLAAKNSFVWLKRDATPLETKEINALGEPAIGFHEDNTRVYPYGSLFSHVLGYVDPDGNGLSGIEKSVDSGLIKQQENGQVRLSLDVRVQGIVRDELQSAVDAFSAIGAVGLALDINSGELISMVSLPDFDPHKAGKAGKDKIFNRAALGVYEMGSTFKAITAAMALDSNRVSINDGFDATNPIKFANFTITDYHAKKRWLSVPEVFMYSSNIGTAKMALEVGPIKQKEFMGRLGLFEPVDIGLPEKGMPIVPKTWGELTAMTVSYGHGIAVSPLHMMKSLMALLNGGMLKPITLVHEGNGALAGERVVSEKTSRELRSLMRLVVAHGTGSKGDVEGYYVGGKTGTAEKSSKGAYDSKALISSFICAFPINDPKYLLLVILDEPKGTKETAGYATAGWTAAPAAARIIERMAPLMGIRPIRDMKDPFMQREFEQVQDEGGVRLASYSTGR